jgi:hypothetical protein
MRVQFHDEHKELLHQGFTKLILPETYVLKISASFSLLLVFHCIFNWYDYIGPKYRIISKYLIGRDIEVSGCSPIYGTLPSFV